MTRPPLEGKVEDESTLDHDEPSKLDLVGELAVSEDTYDDDGTGGDAFGDAPIDDETPVDDFVGLPGGDGDPGIDTQGEEPMDDTTLPPDASGIDDDEADTPTDAISMEGLDEEITLPPGPDDDADDGGPSGERRQELWRGGAEQLGSRRLTRRTSAVALIAASAALLFAPVAHGTDKFLQMMSPTELEHAPSQKYARLSREDAVAELKTRGIGFDEVPAERAPGVIAPVRLTSRLSGVLVHGMLKGAAAETTPFEIVDARLALAISDFARLLAANDIDDLTHFSMYRPGRAAKPGILPSEGQATSRHPAGLAIDVAFLRKKDGTTLRVDKHFGGKIGGKTCGEGAVMADTDEARQIRKLVCDAADQRLFTYVLSPNYNSAHRDHLHMEIKAGVKWMLVH